MLNNVETEKTGLHKLILDDIRKHLIETAFRKPDENMTAAFNDLEIDRLLIKNAAKRGVDPKIMEETSKNITFVKRCNRSIYSKKPEQKQTQINNRDDYLVR